MKYKTKLLVDRFTSIISAWPGVECISLNEAAMPDTLDPYFTLILDIYYRDPLPGPEERVIRRMFLASPLSSSLSKGRDTEARGAAVGNEKAPGKPAAKSLARYSSNGFRESLCGTIIIK